MTTPDNNSQPYDAAFQQIAAIIRQEQHNDASLFRMIAGMIGQNAPFAIEFAAAVSTILDGHTAEVDYTEVVVEAYRRTVFPGAGEDSFDYFEGSTAKAAEFAATVVRLHNSGSSFMQATHFLN